MNRPRNRSSRPPRGGPLRTDHSNMPAATPKINLPSTRLVVPGASVSIVLKADQATGRAVPGIVQDVLTRGNHPRGIKVRLQDHRVGRVQRMVSGDRIPTAATAQNSQSRPTDYTEGHAYDSNHLREPDPRSLGDFFVEKKHGGHAADSAPRISPPAAANCVKCPICGDFEGDELAVSHHVLQHLD